MEMLRRKKDPGVVPQFLLQKSLKPSENLFASPHGYWVRVIVCSGSHCYLAVVGLDSTVLPQFESFGSTVVHDSRHGLICCFFCGLLKKCLDSLSSHSWIQGMQVIRIKKVALYVAQ